MDESKREGVSRLLSLILRHKPERFELELDAQGYALIDEILDAVRQKYTDLTEDELLEVINGQERPRFETKDDLVRARYGHSFAIDLGLPPATPPEFLYYAGTPAQLRMIVTDGLKPGDRQYVHLSTTEETASGIASSRTETPIVFRIHASEAAVAGVRFYDRMPVYLTTEVPPAFIEVPQDQLSGRSPLYGRQKRLKTPRRSA